MMKRRMTAVLMTAALVAASPAAVLADSVTVEPEGKQYVIVAEDKEAYAAVSEEIGEGAMAEDPVLKENQVIAAVLTEAEAEALGEDGVLVEEDIILSGSTEETGGEVLTEERDGEEETVITEEEARQRKLAVKQKKQEALDRDGEEDGTDETEDGNEPEWNLKAVNAEGLAEEGEGKVRAKVAVLDSGVDYVTGINLEGYVNLVEGEEELSPIFQDLTGHGTGIAGIISGNGETGIHGVNPHAEVYSVKVLDGENKAPLSRIIKGIYWCIEAEMDIINMSFGTPVYSKALEQAVKDADAAGILMVGAAGNGGGAVEYPAAFPEVMAVAAAGPEAEVSEFSNTGEELDVAAPGEKVRVAAFFDGKQVTHGTSIAVPHVTGAASLLWEKDLTKPSIFIRRLIEESAKEMEGTDACGLLDVGYALEAYDGFAERFDEEGETPETGILKNTETPESFEEVNTDEAYVEGRWGGSNHKAAVDTGSKGKGFSTAAINVIKQGAVYPDQSDWQGGNRYPWWHGRWETKESTVTDYKIKKGGKEVSRIWDVNYAAVLEMVTEVATEGGEIKPYMKCSYFPGMDSYTYHELKKNLNSLKKKYATILSSNTKANRKYFLYGCAIHSITDAFAHSTTYLDGNRIKHDGNGKVGNADKIGHVPDRYAVAVYVTRYLLEELKYDVFSDGDQIISGIKKKFKSGNATFKMIRLKQYINQNECYDAILDKLNIDKAASE